MLIIFEKIYQTLKTLFDRLSKHLEARHKYSLRVLLSTLFSVLGNVVKYGLSYLTGPTSTSVFCTPVLLDLALRSDGFQDINVVYASENYYL